METTKKEPRSTKDQSTSAMGTTEGARRATGIVPMAGASAHLVSSAPDPEVSEKRPRRKFTAKYKLRILSEADACTQPGQFVIINFVKFGQGHIYFRYVLAARS